MMSHLVGWVAAAMLVVSSSTLGVGTVGAQQLMANGNGQERAMVTPAPRSVRLVTLDLRNVSAADALREITRQTGVAFSYRVGLLPQKMVTIRVTDVPLEVAAARILAGMGVGFGARTETQIALVADGSRVQNGTIMGKVTNAKTGKPVVGVAILLDGATKGVVTDQDGAFRFPATHGEHQVTVRGVGFVKQIKRATVGDGQTVMLEFVLEPSASVLDEVIVTGTVVATERKAIPNPITVLTAEDIEKRGITRIDQLLRGEVPGVVAAEQGSNVYNSYTLGAMSTAQVYSRGGSNLNAGATPLKTFVDGVEILNGAYLGTIDPKSIERIEIITGPQAATVYGSGAMGGVMQIFTKKGSGRSTSEATLTLKYGVLETNMSSGKTPSHNDALNIMGGAGPDFSYSAGVSYVYSGQWQPYLFNKQSAASVGATHSRGALTASGSASATLGANGTFYTSPLGVQRANEGEWTTSVRAPSQRRSTSVNQTYTLNVDLRQLSFLQHHLTVGTSRNSFEFVPEQPMFTTPADSMYTAQSLSGQRTTIGYNVTIQPPTLGALSSNMTIGVTGSLADQTQITGTLLSKDSPSYTTSSVSTPLDNKAWGGFGRMQVGLFDKLYATTGLRGERNPNYGRSHPVDWTITNGLAYTVERDDITLKLLASYGRATRPPRAEQRLAQVQDWGPDYKPMPFVWLLENPDLRPENSRGPQGGVEMYFGNRASLTLNRYQQTVEDLIDLVRVDSTLLTYLGTESWYEPVYRNVNIRKVYQRGWEATGSLNVLSLSVKGTYSWTTSGWCGSCQFIGIPTHTGNLTANWARGKTSITLVTNYMGEMIRASSTTGGAIGEVLFYAAQVGRLKMYIPLSRAIGIAYAQPGYVKSDMNVSQRLNPWASLTLNVTNLGNSFGSEGEFTKPALGRTTTMGISLRYPASR